MVTLNMSNIHLIKERTSTGRSNKLPRNIRKDHNRFRPQICENGKVRGLGSFETIKEAEIVQLKAEIARDKRYIEAAQKVVAGMEKRLTELQLKLKQVA
jgi:hypothetical protein